MPLYETVLIARNDVTQAQVESIVDEMNTLLEQDGGAIKKREYWGLRSLAYRIKKNRKGHYMLLGIDAKPEQIREFERQLGLNEDILRLMTLRIEEIDEAPSVILSRRGDERGERGLGGGGGFRPGGAGKPAGRFESGRGPRRNFEDREEYRARDEGQPAPAAH